MGLAERVSRQNVKGAAKAALLGAEDACNKVDEMVARHNEQAVAIGGLSKRLDDLGKRQDAQGQLIVAVSDRQDALATQLDAQSNRIDDLGRIVAGTMDYAGEIAAVGFLQHRSFWARLRWLFTGKTWRDDAE